MPEYRYMVWNLETDKAHRLSTTFFSRTSAERVLAGFVKNNDPEAAYCIVKKTYPNGNKIWA